MSDSGDQREWPEEPAERVRELVEGVLDELDLEGEVEINEDDEAIEAAVVGEDDYGLLIGRRGTLFLGDSGAGGIGCAG